MAEHHRRRTLPDASRLCLSHHLVHLCRLEALGTEQVPEGGLCHLRSEQGVTAVGRHPALSIEIRARRSDGDDGLVNVGLHVGLHHARHLADTLGQLGHLVVEDGVELSQDGDHLVAEHVPLGVVLQVRAVHYVFLSDLIEIVEYLLPGASEHRTEDMSVPRTDALQATDARAPHEVEQHRLHLVVLVMGDDDAVRVYVTSQLLEVAVAQLACRHLYRHMVKGGMALRVEVDAVEGHVEMLAERHAELLVALALLPAQMEVAVHGLRAVAEREQGAEQGHAVGTA